MNMNHTLEMNSWVVAEWKYLLYMSLRSHCIDYENSDDMKEVRIRSEVVE